MNPIIRGGSSTAMVKPTAPIGPPMKAALARVPIFHKTEEIHRELRYINEDMETASRRKDYTTRIIRDGDSLTQDSHWDKATPEQRIEAVWSLTLLCLAWQSKQADEPRLQRSISRIQRPQR